MFGFLSSLGSLGSLGTVRLLQFACILAMLLVGLTAGCDAAYGCDQSLGICHGQQLRQQVIVQPQVLYSQQFVQPQAVIVQKQVQAYAVPQAIVQKQIVQRQVVRERNRFRLQLPVRREAVQKQVIIQQQIRGY